MTVDDRPRPLTEHLEELRRRLLWCLGAFLAFVIGWVALPSPSHSFAMTMLAWWRRTLLPPEATLIFLDPLEPLVTVLKVGFYASCLMSAPVIGYHVYAFLMPALPWLRKPVVGGTVAVSVALVGAGAWIAFRVILPASFGMFVRYGMEMGIQPQLAMGRFVGLVGGMLLLFSLPYLLPVVMAAAAAAGLLSVQRLRAMRRYVYLSLAIFSAVMTPDPTIFSMVVLTVSLTVLYEAGILACAWIVRRRPVAASDIGGSLEAEA